MCSPANAILGIIATIFLSFEAILKRFKSPYIKIASTLTSIVTILANIALAGEHIIPVLAQ